MFMISGFKIFPIILICRFYCCLEVEPWELLSNLPFEGCLLINRLLIKNKYSDIFKHNQTCPGIIQAYSDIFRTLFNPGAFRTRGLFRTFQKSTMGRFAKKVDSNYLRKLQLLLQGQFFMSSTWWNEYHDLFNTNLNFTLEVFILCKKVWG